MEDKLKTNEELVDLYKKARTATINELLEKKSSHKRVMALEKMWLDEQIKQGMVCSKCHTSKELTVDHIIPASMLELFGLWPNEVFMPKNYDVLCKRCNFFKNYRLDFSNSKTKPLLKEFLESIY